MAENSRAMNLGEFVDGKPQQLLPDVLSNREAELSAFQDRCKNLVSKILTLFAVGLHVSLS
jgi:isopenicillin N synthase-like dioxygenase